MQANRFGISSRINALKSEKNTDQSSRAKKIGDRLNAVLDDHGYPPKFHGRHEQLAHDLGVTPKTAANWLNGDKYPTQERVIAICHQFNLSHDWLMTGLGMQHPMTDQEKRLIHCVRGLPPAAQAAVYRAAQADPDFN
jgi:transcriptional regulator with XRE-family HTH domain